MIRAATHDAGELLDVDRGTLEPGARADVVLLPGDPEGDSRPFRHPIAVIKDGAIAFRRA